MANPHADWNAIPAWCIAAPLAGAVLVAAKFAHVIDSGHAIVLVLAVAMLGGAVFAAVHHAEALAVKIGDPLGSILLALAITALEVGLIISVMVSSASGGSAVARDTVFAVVMIVLNGILGLCLIVGGVKHFAQEFKLQGAAGTLSVIATLSIVALILPNYTLASPIGTFNAPQLLVIGLASLVLYLLFVFVLSVRHKDDFVALDDHSDHGTPPNTRTVVISAVLLVVSLAVVILLAKTLTPSVEGMVAHLGLPHALVGVVIAMVVLLPEGMTAVKAARQNRLQASLNASLGSAAASIGLTIPIVGTASVLLGQELTLGIDQEGTVLLMLTLFVATLTFATGRTTILQGAVHVFIFAVFLLLSAIP